MSALARFLGDSPLRVLVKLIILSFLVGLLMSAFGWTPRDVYEGIRDAILNVWHRGFDAIDGFVGYLLLGAGVVVPAFIVLRLLSWRRT